MRMPGSAAQTTGTALTARLAVKPGDSSPIRSSGTAKRRSTSSGRRRRRPPASRSAGGPSRRRGRSCSTSWRGSSMSGSPSRQPETTIRWAATVPASMVPAAISTVVRRRWPPRRSPPPSRAAARAPRPPAAATGRSSAPPWDQRAVVERGGVGAEAHQVEQQLGRVALRQVGELVDPELVEPALDRGQHERHGLGDEPRAAAGAVDRGAALAARRLDPRPLVRDPCWPGGGTRPGWSPRSSPDSSSAADLVEVARPAACRARSRRRAPRISSMSSGGEDAGRAEPAQLAGVDARLVRRCARTGRPA